MLCVVCNITESKYRCPKCKTRYCSGPCYKEHVCTVCDHPGEVQEIDVSYPKLQDLLFPTDDTVLPQMLEKLKESTHLCSMLTNPHLRDILVQVDSSEKVEKHIQAAMMEPIFTQFVDVCLSIVDPQENDSDSSMD
ncbi:zinc finger HIT domain-containing protein 3 [Oratosquilla oratoria]|uniref:zinc finger HIT domain-containing protein 3 n=1 Tax=Oratosquilla oratoria TaxID=337810 RepID=UPI003F76D899